jgi:chromosomal replication initiator protein
MKAWQQFIVEQEAELGLETVHKWLKPLKILHFDACNLYLEAKDSFQALWFEEHIRPKIQKLVNNNNKRIKVHLSILSVETPKPLKVKGKKVQEEVVEAPKFTLNFDPLDEGCRLDNFVLNDNNILIHKLLCKILNNTSELASFNPVYIHGPSGTGKTHLLMAVAQSLRSLGLNVIYTRAETFTEHVVTAIRAGEMSIFRQAYRKSDVLIIDDVHVFSRKHATQEELFHTFNALHLSGKQIILSANCSPADLQMIEPRLISRFEWGIVLPLEPLNNESIRQVLEHKMADMNFAMHPKVQEFLVETFSSSVKSLTRALHALILRSHLSVTSKEISGTHLTLPHIKQLLKDLIHDEEHSALTPQKIVQCVAEYFGIRLEDILGKTQTRDYVMARQIAMFLCRHRLKMSYLKIGEFFAKDHSTVMSSVKVIQNGIDNDDRDISNPYEAIIKKLQSLVSERVS